MSETEQTTILTDEATVESPRALTEATPADERFLSAVEALLFAAHQPLSSQTLCATNGHAQWSLDDVVGEINRRYEAGQHPMRVRKVAGGYQLHLLPEYAAIVEAHLVKEKTQRLSRAGLETLAIIAYRQPCSTPEIERVRGVACDGVLRTLIERNLVTIKGRSEAPGRPLLYVTTSEFLRYFGLDSIGDLPAEDELRELMALRTPAEGDPLAAYAREKEQQSLFGTIVLKRGPEQADPDAGFRIVGVAAEADRDNWLHANQADTEPETETDLDDIADDDSADDDETWHEVESAATG